jgi:hypothetical protein
MPKKAKGGKKKKGADGPPGDYMMGKSKEKTVEAELNQARSRFVSLQAELIQRSDESSRALAELRIAEKQRDGVRAQSSGMGEDIVSVQRDFARLFRVCAISTRQIMIPYSPNFTYFWHPLFLSSGSTANID